MTCEEVGHDTRKFWISKSMPSCNQKGLRPKTLHNMTFFQAYSQLYSGSVAIELTHVTAPFHFCLWVVQNVLEKNNKIRGYKRVAVWRWYKKDIFEIICMHVVFRRQFWVFHKRQLFAAVDITAAHQRDMTWHDMTCRMTDGRDARFDRSDVRLALCAGK